MAFVLRNITMKREKQQLLAESWICLFFWNQKKINAATSIKEPRSVISREEVERAKENTLIFFTEVQSVLIKTKVGRDGAKNYYENIQNSQEFRISSHSNLNQSQMMLHHPRLYAYMHG